MYIDSEQKNLCVFTPPRFRKYAFDLDFVP